MKKWVLVGGLHHESNIFKPSVTNRDNIWVKREEFCFYNETRMPKDALEKALDSVRNNVYPVVLSDSGDTPTAGSSWDITNFLKLILERK